MSIITPVPPDLGPSASSSTSSTSAFSFQTADLLEILEDLSTRFILNLPPSELSSIPRICFQVEQAFWFYEDFNRELNPSLPSYTLKRFSEIFFKVCPLLSEWSDEHEQMFLEFMRYKMRVPVCGAILINETWDKCLLVKGWKGNTWSFPKGKINQEEPKHICAAREVLEETGYDCTRLLNKDNFLETNIQGQRVTLFIVPGVSQDYQFKTLTRKEIGAIQWFKLKHLPGWKRKNMPAGSSLSSKVGNFKFYMILPFVQFLQQFIKENKPRNLLKNADVTPSVPSMYPLPNNSSVSGIIESPSTHKQLTVPIDLVEPVVPEAEIPGTSSKSDSISALDELFKRFLDSHESDATTFDEGERTRGTNTPVPTFMPDSKPAMPEAKKETVSMLDNLFGNITLSHPQPQTSLDMNLSASSSEFSSLAPTPSPGGMEASVLPHFSTASSTPSLGNSSTSAGTAASASMYHVQPQPQPHSQSGPNGPHRAPNPSLLALLNPAHPSPSVEHRQPQIDKFGSVSQSPMYPTSHSSAVPFRGAPLWPVPSYSSASASSSDLATSSGREPRLTLSDARLKEPVEHSSPLSQSATNGLPVTRTTGVDSNTAAKNLSKEKMSLLQTFLSPPSVHKLPHHQQQRQHQQQSLSQLERHESPCLSRRPDGTNGNELQENHRASLRSIIDQPSSITSPSSHLTTSVRPPAFEHLLSDQSNQRGVPVQSHPSTAIHSHHRTPIQHHTPTNVHQQTLYQPYPQPPLLNHTPQSHHLHPHQQPQQQHGLRYQHQSPSLSFNQPVGYHSPSASIEHTSSSIEPSLSPSFASNDQYFERQPQSFRKPLDGSLGQRGYPDLPHLSSSAGLRGSPKERAVDNEFQIQTPPSYDPTQPSFASMSSFPGMSAIQQMPSSPSARPPFDQPQEHQYRSQQPEVHRPIPIIHAQTSQHDLFMTNAQTPPQHPQVHRPQQYDEQQNRDLTGRSQLKALLTGSSASGPDLGRAMSGSENRPGLGGQGGGAQSLLDILNGGGGGGLGGRGSGVGAGGRSNGTEAGMGRSQW